MELIFHVLRGIAIGLANIIPGVSGGTMALILGIYERLIRAIRNVGPQTFFSVFKGKNAFINEMKRVDALMVGAILIGAVLAVVGSAKLLVYLLNHQHDPTYGFFFGLVLVSVIVPYRMIKKIGPTSIVSALLGIILVVGVSAGLSGEKRVASAQRKAEIKAKKKVLKHVDGDALKKKKEYSVQADMKTLIFFLLAGAVSISAMILPGISGSFVLLLMGVYFDVLLSINERNFVVLGVFALGCLIGIIVFTRLINLALEKAYDATLAFLTGLVIGSLYAIWPFKSFAIVANQRVDKSNILPSVFGGNEILTLITTLIGAGIVALFIWIEIKSGKNKTADQAVL